MSDKGFGGRGGRKQRTGADGSDVAWRELMKDLKAGQSVEIPVADDRELEKRQQQLTKRAERHGFQIEVNVDHGVLRARRVGDVDPSSADRSGRSGDREERREQRRATRARGELGGDE